MSEIELVLEAALNSSGKLAFVPAFEVLSGNNAEL